ncbi:12031_t:CDS:2 [Entrophospora sp. SA101]|nr:12031_t:CDS:2 [Entrophospora sp. SA101]
MNSDELQETIHEINFDEPQETIHEINSNEFQEIIHSNVSQEIICEMNSDELQETIHEINFDEPQETIHKINTLIPQNKIEKRRNELIEHVKNLPESQIINAYTLFSTMTYNKGNHCGEIYSSYIQKKAKEFVNSSIYKQSSSISLKMKEVKAKETKKNHVSKLRQSIQKTKQITPNQLQNAIKKMIKENKKQYTPEFVELVTKISNTGSISISSTVECTRAIMQFLTGEKPDHWLSTGTISHWNKEVATLCLHQNCPKDTKSLFKFLTGFDTVLRIANEDETKCLPLGNRAHEMPDQVFIWIDELEKAAENPELIFKEEFENAQNKFA